MTKKHTQILKQTDSTRTGAVSQPSELPTFLDHIRELRRRLFWVVAAVLVASSAAYPFLDTIIGVLTKPLGSQQLYYLTPIGGFSFSIQLCLYVGIMAGVPLIMYHLYRYLEPLMGKWRKPAVYYVGFSSLFAVIGLLFAYFVSLPSALHFLTGLNLNNIQAMLTVDSYLRFVMTYMLGAAILFQIPLLLLITNNMTPLQPGKLMKLQKFVIIGAFIIAAIISPTPDIMNQLMLALPIILMYQLGVVFVWIQNHSRARRNRREQKRQAVQAQPLFVIKKPPAPRPSEVPSAALVSATPQRRMQAPATAPRRATAAPTRRFVALDGFVASRVPDPQPLPASNLPVPTSGFKDAGVAAKNTPPLSARDSYQPALSQQHTTARRSGQRPAGLAVPVRANGAIHVPTRTVDGFSYRSAPAVYS